MKFPQLCIVVESKWCSYCLAFVRDKRAMINIKAFSHSPLVIITSSAKSDSWCSVALLYAQTAIRGESLFLNRWEVMFWSLRGLSKTSPHHTEKIERRRFLSGALHSGACFRSQQQQLPPLPRTSSGFSCKLCTNFLLSDCFAYSVATPNTTLIFNSFGLDRSGWTGFLVVRHSSGASLADVMMDCLVPVCLTWEPFVAVAKSILGLAIIVWKVWFPASPQAKT